jgi:hypothetical protein
MPETEYFLLIRIIRVSYKRISEHPDIAVPHPNISRADRSNRRAINCLLQPFETRTVPTAFPDLSNHS